MSFSKFFAISISLMLLLAFGIHAIDFFHSHPHGTVGEGFEGVLHATDRKLLLLIFVSALSFLVVFSTNIIFDADHIKFSINKIFSRKTYKILPHIDLSFKKGIIHPQVY